MNIDVARAYCAALVHDVGYLPQVQRSGFHPIDGAEMLRERGYPMLASLIEWHSCSPEEATILGYQPVHLSTDIIAKLITFWNL